MSDTPAEQPPTPEQQAVLSFLQRLYTCCPQTRVTHMLLISNFIVFGVMLLLGASLISPEIGLYIEYGANFGPLTKDGDWWRLFSAMFLHFGIIHILFNMWALWDAGRLTERLYGPAAFLSLYMFAGLAGSLASLYWNNDTVASIGASGAVFGVFGALLAYLLRQKNTVPPQLLKRLAASALFFMGLSLFYGFSKSGIDNAAHIGGLLAGFFIGLILARPICEYRQSNQTCKWLTLASSLAVLLAIVLAPAASFKYPDEIAAEKKLQHYAEQEKRLLKTWHGLVEQLQSGEDDYAANAVQTLNNIQQEWLQLEQDITDYGDIREATAQAMDKLGQYSQYRSKNARYLIRYLETADNHYIEQLNENSKQIEKILNDITKQLKQNYKQADAEKSE